MSLTEQDLSNLARRMADLHLPVSIGDIADYYEAFHEYVLQWWNLVKIVQKFKKINFSNFVLIFIAQNWDILGIIFEQILR